MRIGTTVSALAVVICGALFGQSAVADVTIQYNDYSGSPTIGRGNGTSTDPHNPGYGAMRIFIEKVIEYTDEHGPDALPVGQKVVFQRNQSTGRAVNALRAGVQFANANAQPQAGRVRSQLGLYLQFGALWDEFPADAWISLRCEAGWIRGERHRIGTSDTG